MMKNIKNILLTAIITVLAGVAIKVFDGSGDANPVINAVKEQVSAKMEQMLLGKKSQLSVVNDAKSDENADGNGQKEEMMSESEKGPDMVTIGGITFPMSSGYEIVARESLKNNAEACMITTTWKPREEGHRLILKIDPNAMQGINGMTDEEVGDMLYDYVNALAGVLVKKEGITLENQYKVNFDNNADGSYHPHCYCYMNWKEADGLQMFSYTEAALVNGKIVSGCAISPDEDEMNALSDVYREAVAGATDN